MSFLSDLLGVEISTKDTYNFMVVSALQEELNEFYSQHSDFDKREKKEGGAFKVSLSLTGKRKIDILTYTPNKMGMPFNAASIMRIISIHQPVYSIFIGTCAGLKTDNRKGGDVLIPFRVFSYESGKFEDGKFLPDYMNYETGELLRKEAEVLNNRIKTNLTYKVITDEDFCSGSAVIDDKSKREEIITRSGRKVSGLDMEAYSIACLNSVLRPENKELLVVKGIMDFAMDKEESEQTGSKELAKRNSANFAFELIKHLDKEIFTTKGNIEIY